MPLAHSNHLLRLALVMILRTVASGSGVVETGQVCYFSISCMLAPAPFLFVALPSRPRPFINSVLSQYQAREAVTLSI